MIDGMLEKRIIDYNKYRLHCFKSNIPIRFSDNNFERILKNRYNKVSRIKRRFVWLLTRYKYNYFCTFTFDDKTIKKCDRTKKDLIKSSLLSFDSEIQYILNIDYGKQTEREHYHAIIGTNCSLDLRKHLSENYPCRSGCDIIRKTGDDVKKISKYINKLSNHCLKDTTNNSRIIYNFKGYDIYKPPLNRYLYIIDSYNFRLW